MTDQLTLLDRIPRSCIRNQSQENLLERTKIVLAVPSYNRQRLSGIRRGWCPSRFPKTMQGTERVVRSDSGVAHRLSSSARVVSAADRQVKTKRQAQKRLLRLRNKHVRNLSGSSKALLWKASPRIIRRAEATPSSSGSAINDRRKMSGEGPAPGSGLRNIESAGILYYPGNIPILRLSGRHHAQFPGGRRRRTAAQPIAQLPQTPAAELPADFQPVAE
jgi:hypothetical protein